MRLHYLQHVPFEGPGFIETWAKEQKYSISATRFFEGDVLPDPGSFDALIVLGGPMSVFEEEQYPWLIEEKQFINESIDKGKKVLGICLGAQLLAHVLGAAVKPATNKEIGWFPIFPTDESKLLPWFHELFSNHPLVFHWHADKFEIPFGAINLASSEANKNQAFAVNDQLLGLQFHVEPVQDNVNELVKHMKRDLVPGNFIQNEVTLKSGMPAGDHLLLCDQLLDRFLH